MCTFNDLSSNRPVIIFECSQILQIYLLCKQCEIWRKKITTSLEISIFSQGVTFLARSVCVVPTIGNIFFTNRVIDIDVVRWLFSDRLNSLNYDVVMYSVFKIKLLTVNFHHFLTVTLWCAQNESLDRVFRYCLKVRADEQSVMKFGRWFQARGPATANAWSPIMWHQQGQMKMMTAVDRLNDFL